jgi:hypothetical protein
VPSLLVVRDDLLSRRGDVCEGRKEAEEAEVVSLRSTNERTRRRRRDDGGSTGDECIGKQKDLLAPVMPNFLYTSRYGAEAPKVLIPIDS